MTRRRHLSDEEQALWTGFTRSITPLQRARPSGAAAEANPPAAAESASAVPDGAASHDRASVAKPLPLAPFERRLRQRVARGRDAIDARIDLHGMTQTEAHAALLHFLRRAQASESKIVLVVTGKGAGKSSGDAASERGVLKRQVPLWLALPEFRPFVVGFEDAHASHGGQGALYVRLRRAR